MSNPIYKFEIIHHDKPCDPKQGFGPLTDIKEFDNYSDAVERFESFVLENLKSIVAHCRLMEYSENNRKLLREFKALGLNPSGVSFMNHELMKIETTCGIDLEDRALQKNLDVLSGVYNG